MARTKIAIACQGGGSQTAFTAGVLKHLLETGRGKFDMVSVSGTSGGAVCAALAWYGIRKGEKPACGRLIEFWKDNATQNVVEDAFNQWLVQSMRLVNHGMMPVLMHSPSSPWVQASVRMISAGFRDTFSDFPHLLSK